MIELKRKHIPYGYKLTAGNVGVKDKKITIPHYMAMFLNPCSFGESGES